jgi:hypothetical protein
MTTEDEDWDYNYRINLTDAGADISWKNPNNNRHYSKHVDYHSYNDKPF